MENSLLLSSRLPQEILYNVISFLDSNEVEKCQLINKNWKNLVDFNKNFLSLRYFEVLWLSSRQNLPVLLRVHTRTITEACQLQIQVDDNMIAELMNNHRGKNNLKSMDETLKMLKRAVFRIILVVDCDSAILEPFLRHAKKIIGDGFRAKSCNCNARYLDILGVEIFGNYLHVDKLELRESSEQFIKDVFSHSEDKMLPSLPKEIHLGELHMQDEEALQFNGLLDAADRLTLIISPHSHGNFCQSWFNMYKNCQDLSKLIGTFEFHLKKFCKYQGKSMFDRTIEFLKENKIQHTTERDYGILRYFYTVYNGHSYQLVIIMKYNVQDFLRNNSLEEAERAGIDFNALGFNNLDRVSYCVKKL